LHLKVRKIKLKLLIFSMKRIIIGLIIGLIAGMIDVIPMFLQSMKWEAIIAAFLMWIIIGFFIATSDLKMKSIPKGIIISLLIMLPSSILIGWEEPLDLIPIFILTILLGGAAGYCIKILFYSKEKQR
jgi:hypothetical protein